MKKLLSCLLAVTVATTAFVGCKKDKDSEPATSMTCKIDGTVWTGVVFGAAIQNGTINITSKAADSSLVTITLTGDDVGTYAIDLTNNDGALAYRLNGGVSSWTSNTIDNPFGSSTCTVTEIDTTNKTISGTFTCYTANFVDGTFKEFTEGVFTNIPYTVNTGTTGTNTFAVKYDGTSLVPTTISGAKTTLGTSIITLTASDNGPAHTVGIVMPSSITAGSYSIGGFGSTYYGTYYLGSTYYVSSTGQLVITQHDVANKKIVGTFNFNASPFSGGGTAVSLTQGAFSITYL